MYCYKCLNTITGIDHETARYGLHAACFSEWFNAATNQEFKEIAIKSASSSGHLSNSHSRRNDATQNPAVLVGGAVSASTESTESSGAGAANANQNYRGKSNSNIFAQINSSFFQGKFKKYSAKLGDISYILKVEDDRYPALPATEYLSNQIARQFKIDVPSFFYIKFPAVRGAFVSKNFMHDYPAGNLVHIYHYLDATTQFDCANLITIIGEQTQRLTDIETFIRVCLFDALIGNHDRHGRNLAFIQTAKGIRLSPIYDNTSYLGIESDDMLAADMSPRGKIGTLTEVDPSMRSYIIEFIRLGYANVVYDFFRDANLRIIGDIIQKSFITQNRKDAMMRLINKRYVEMAQELGGVEALK
jgi:hypothetical protein